MRETMEELVQFGDLAFDPSFIFARKGESEIRFTRNERALLLALAANPRRLMRRDRLLDAISQAGSDVSDRNIDFLVNRLRAKLNDSARSPTYIATQYGEGYVWIAERNDSRPLDAFLVIGPVFGISGEGFAPRARVALDHLRTAIDARTAPDSRIVIAEGWRPSAPLAHKIRYYLEISFHARGADLHAAAVLRDMPARRILRAFRFVLDDAAAARQELERISASVTDAIWQALSGGPKGPSAPSDVPLELRLHDASVLLSTTDQAWLESGERLAKARAADPSDARTAIMWSMHLYARLVLAGPFGGITPQDHDAMESEIEALALEALPAIQDDPLLVLAVAKLLFFIDRGYLDLAESLADRVFAESTAFAAAFSILGQLRAARGHFAEAMKLYDRGIEIAEDGSEFHVYLIVLKLTAALAAADRMQVEAVFGRLVEVKPQTLGTLGLCVAMPDEPLMPQHHAFLEAIGGDGARKFLHYFYMMSARHFVSIEDRGNVVRGMASHVAARYGAESIPDLIGAAVGPMPFGA